MRKSLRLVPMIAAFFLILLVGTRVFGQTGQTVVETSSSAPYNVLLIGNYSTGYSYSDSGWWTGGGYDTFRFGFSVSAPVISFTLDYETWSIVDNLHQAADLKVFRESDNTLMCEFPHPMGTSSAWAARTMTADCSLDPGQYYLEAYTVLTTFYMRDIELIAFFSSAPMPTDDCGLIKNASFSYSDSNPDYLWNHINSPTFERWGGTGPYVAALDYQDGISQTNYVPSGQGGLYAVKAVGWSSTAPTTIQIQVEGGGEVITATGIFPVGDDTIPVTTTMYVYLQEETNYTFSFVNVQNNGGVLNLDWVCAELTTSGECIFTNYSFDQRDTGWSTFAYPQFDQGYVDMPYLSTIYQVPQLQPGQYVLAVTATVLVSNPVQAMLFAEGEASEFLTQESPWVTSFWGSYSTITMPFEVLVPDYVRVGMGSATAYNDQTPLIRVEEACIYTSRLTANDCNLENYEFDQGTLDPWEASDTDRINMGEDTVTIHEPGWTTPTWPDYPWIRQMTHLVPGVTYQVLVRAKVPLLGVRVPFFAALVVDIEDGQGFSNEYVNLVPYGVIPYTDYTYDITIPVTSTGDVTVTIWNMASLYNPIAGDVPLTIDRVCIRPYVTPPTFSCNLANWDMAPPGAPWSHTSGVTFTQQTGNSVAIVPPGDYVEQNTTLGSGNYWVRVGVISPMTFTAPISPTGPVTVTPWLSMTVEWVCPGCTTTDTVGDTLDVFGSAGYYFELDIMSIADQSGALRITNNGPNDLWIDTVCIELRGDVEVRPYIDPVLLHLCGDPNSDIPPPFDEPFPGTNIGEYIPWLAKKLYDTVGYPILCKLAEWYNRIVLFISDLYNRYIDFMWDYVWPFIEDVLDAIISLQNLWQNFLADPWGTLEALLSVFIQYILSLLQIPLDVIFTAAWALEYFQSLVERALWILLRVWAVIWWFQGLLFVPTTWITTLAGYFVFAIANPQIQPINTPPEILTAMVELNNALENTNFIYVEYTIIGTMAIRLLLWTIRKIT